eukprot:725973-Rhodomonas_salina.1
MQGFVKEFGGENMNRQRFIHTNPCPRPTSHRACALFAASEHFQAPRKASCFLPQDPTIRNRRVSSLFSASQKSIFGKWSGAVVFGVEHCTLQRN